MSILILDFPGVRRGESRGSINVCSLDHESVQVIRQPTPEEVQGRRYAAALLAGIEESVVMSAEAVFAYCAAAPLAQEFAQLLVERGMSPLPLVLFDPDQCSEGSVMEGFCNCARECGGPEPEADERAALLRLMGRPLGFLSKARGLLERRAVVALRDHGIDDNEVDELAEELLRPCLDYLRYLLAAHHSSFPAWGGGVVCVQSRDSRAPNMWPNSSGFESVRLPGLVDSSSFFESDLLAEMLHKTLARRGPWWPHPSAQQ